MKVRYYLFPFAEVERGSKVIIYGGGIIGRQFLEQINHLNYSTCLFFVDKNAADIQQINGVEVFDTKKIIEHEFDKIIIASLPYGDEIYDMLLNWGIPKNKIVQKIVVHEFEYRRSTFLITPDPQNSTAWDSYYSLHEQKAKEQFDAFFAPVLSRYSDISLERVLDFACGHGRMANIFSERAKNITCCDINDTAINFCKERFRDVQNCSFGFINNGKKNNTLSSIPVEKGAFSFIYSWDAMVHFSYKWLDFYIKEFYRMLQNNAYVFIHHSNYANSGDYESENWYDHQGGRASVGYEDIAFIAENHGFTVVEQKVIDWSIPKLDCISILRK